MGEQPSSREILAAMLWPECDEKRARAGLRQALASLNETPVGQWIDTNHELIHLRRDEFLWVDTARFNELLAAEADQDVLAEAVSLCRNDFMSGFTLRDSAEFDNWQSMQTQVFQQKLISALERLVTLQIAAHEMEKAIQSVQRWLMIDVLHEPAQRQFMRLCTATGQRAAALRQYEAYAKLLQQELGILPSLEMVRLYEAIKNNEPITLEELFPSSCGTLPSLPRLVIGREEALSEIKQRLFDTSRTADSARQSITVVQGWPGVGKTTLVAVLAHGAAVHEHFPDSVLFASLGEQPNLFSV